MKKVLLLTLMALTALTARAYDFEVDGICYTKIPCGEYICTSYQVTVAPHPSGYSGDIVLPGTVTFDGTTYEVLRIGANAFANCPQLTSVTATRGYLAMVAYNAFQNCANLRKVDLPATVTVLDDNLFSGCPSLDSIVLRSNTPPLAAFEDPFSGLNDHAVIVVRCGLAELYRASDVFAGLTVVENCDSPLAIDAVDGSPVVLQAWPNPASHQVSVSADAEVELLDLSGRTLRRQQPQQGTALLPLDGLMPGVYLLRSGAQVAKLVVR